MTMNKKGAVSTGKIKGLIVGIIMIVILFKMSVTLIPEGAEAVHNLSDALASESATIGTDASSFAGNIDDYTGWFWVAGPLLMVIGLVLALFSTKKYRRR